MSKHAPGPWVVVTNSTGTFRVEADSMPTYRELVPSCSDDVSTRVPVCRFHFVDNDEPGAPKLLSIHEANAHLIAAAPELLDSLREIAPRMPDEDAPCHSGIVPQSKCRHCQRIARAIAAIAKAEGRS